ncbi:MAG TPA: glycoside hydrolase family 2 TIM barrel-domain containing protein [Ideonella sp.]|uniref:glycoside hydrolase family 2 protein n=1 Tax=Ideonella sp. TaxID=1929293 RepID=UPI002E2F5928|nr:glycoside hydrolase family 2 TIM barrel-domain containing protein [Ideonella sp.]HEX5686133.1 glycoside hydrolase family 2 TIM barrel-domain containing protein [Ideonella sp.]
MTRLLCLVLAVCAGLFANLAHAVERTSVVINRDWTFTLGNPADAQAPGHDTAQWRRVDLPHSFSEPYFLGTGFYVGHGWYRKQLDIPTGAIGKRITLEFDGVFQDAVVWVNGQKAGRHVGGYTGFEVDITPHVKAGHNLLAVHVNNLWNARVAPRAGEHQFSGGIYRNVRLVVTDPVHVAWYGTFVTTPKVSDDRATVRVQTEVRNQRAAPAKVTLVSEVLDATGKRITQHRSERTVPAAGKFDYDQTLPGIASPRLWSPDQPYLYKLVSQLHVNGKPVDRFETPFGIRTIQFTADKGFFLNGKHFYMVGANVHQDQAGWADGVTDGAARRDVQMVKDAGFNFIRGSHYPHSPAFSKATDELGLLFWSEAPFWGIGGFGADGSWLSSAYPPDAADRPDFEASALQQAAEMIRIHRNHPSIVIWSASNEPFFTVGDAMAPMRDYLKRQVEFMKKLDPTRPVAIGGAQRGEIDKLGDVAGYNGDGTTLFLNPGVPSVVSEYGSTMVDRPGAYEPGFGLMPDTVDKKDSTKPYAWRYPWRSGEALWCAFDHGSIASIEFGSMGFIDYFRLPKRQYHWYRHTYAGVPPPAWPVDGRPAQLQLIASQTVIRGTQGLDDAHLIVSVQDEAGRALSNSPDVTLRIVSGPGKFPTGRSIAFSNKSLVAIRDGQAAITFRSYFAGQTVIEATSPGLKPARITITTTGPDPFVPGQSPLAPDQPVITYPPFTRIAFPGDPVNVTINRPTSTSSAEPGHEGPKANDDQEQTSWQANTKDSSAFWLVHLENVYALHWLAVVMPDERGADFVVEISKDGTDWRQVAEAKGGRKGYDFALFEKPLTATFLRIRFPAVTPAHPAALSEVRVIAKPAN